MVSSTTSFLNRRTPGVYITENSVEPIDLDDRALATAYQAIGSVIDDPQADASGRRLNGDDNPPPLDDLTDSVL